MSEPMRTYRVESQAIVTRFRTVRARNAKEAEEKSIGTKIDHEEDVNEETMGIFEVVEGARKP